MIDFNYTLLIQFVNFLIVLFILNFLLFKPVLRALEKREQTVKNLSDEVEKLRESVRTVEKEYNDLLKERKGFIYTERDRIILSGQEDFSRILENARKETQEEIKKAKEEMEKEAKKVFEELKPYTERLAKEIAEKVLARNLN